MTFPSAFRKQPLFWGGLVLLILAVVGGIVVTDFVSHYAESQERETLQRLATTAATSFDTDTVRKLQGNQSDIGTKAFDQVCEQLRKIHQANTDARFVYLMAQKQNQVIFLADAEPSDSVDYSPPGEVYREASPELRRMFLQGKPLTEGPSHDRWGVWVTGLAPLHDPRTGQVIAVLGLDVSAKH